MRREGRMEENSLGPVTPVEPHDAGVTPLDQQDLASVVNADVQAAWI